MRFQSYLCCIQRQRVSWCCKTSCLIERPCRQKKNAFSPKHIGELKDPGCGRTDCGFCRYKRNKFRYIKIVQPDGPFVNACIIIILLMILLYSSRSLLLNCPEASTHQKSTVNGGFGVLDASLNDAILETTHCENISMKTTVNLLRNIGNTETIREVALILVLGGALWLWEKQKTVKKIRRPSMIKARNYKPGLQTIREHRQYL